MNLTDEEIRIKVAEARGWVQIWKRQCGHNLGAPGAFDWVGREKTGGVEYVLPNYSADLNACAEFEATLNKAEQDAYWCHIVNLCNEAAREQNKFELVGIFYQITATSRQRCLAYLKTKGILP